jgi:hypothetical protein
MVRLLIILVKRQLRRFTNLKNNIQENPNTKTDLQMMNKRQLLIIGFILMAIIVRVLPHPPNVTPILAIALFGGTTFKNKWLGVLLPLIAMGISDMYLGFYSISYWVYGSFFLVSMLGTYWKKIGVKNVLISSLIFFIITNFGVWLGGYPKTIEGFLLCYTMAIPFFINSILGNLFFSYLLKYSFRYSEKKLMLGSSIG